MWSERERRGGCGEGKGGEVGGGEGKISDDTKLDVLLNKPMIHFKRENI